MASNPIDQGPTGRRVAENVRHFRKDRRLSTYALSERLEELGHRLLPSAVTRIERGERRVDADDLVALALALDVSPNALLLPRRAGATTTELAPGVDATAAAAWHWATGEQAGRDWWSETGIHDLDREDRFGRENRPHAQRARFTIEDMAEHKAVLQPLERAVLRALRAGVPRVEVEGYVSFTATSEGVVETLRRLRARDT